MSSQTTVLDARRELAWLVDGNDPYHPDFIRRLNRARQQMIDSGKWRGCKQQVVFEVTGDHFTLPHFLDSVLGVSVDGVPQVVFSESYRYALAGPGDVSRNHPCDGVLVDGGDQWPSSVDHNEGEYLRITLSDPDDIGSVFRIYGTDASSGLRLIDPNGIDGMEIEMVSGTYTTAQTIGKFTGFQKLPTKGRVTVSSWDGSVEEVLQVYEPSETRPRYHRYYIPNSSTTRSVSCLCKVRYTPVTCDADFVIPGNLSALMLGMQAVELQEVRNYQESNIAWGMCYGVLDREYTSYIGSAMPTMDIIGPFQNSTFTMN